MPKTRIGRPAPTEHNPYYTRYINLVPEGDLMAQLERTGRETAKLLRGVSPKKSQFRYAPDKWSVREVLGHLIDAERVFTYRALTFARADATALPAFDENAWAKSSNAGDRPLGDIVNEFEAVRGATVTMFRGFTEEQFTRSGTANNSPISVRALAYIIAGHERHHVKILRERYGL
jgi:hypothetical protein